MENIIQLLKKTNAHNVISPEVNYNNYIHLDLSLENNELVNKQLETAKDYEIYIENYLAQNEAKTTDSPVTEETKPEETKM